MLAVYVSNIQYTRLMSSSLHSDLINDIFEQSGAEMYCDVC